ncbi:hypothetical protein MAE02_03120 [Microvirga aerophila]|uniref:Uncharacterized protein n=1 Tax=Microvirga aerophila TaxID=670291 RepID=A0A512BKW8_9HYPH|nr:hypothetical protein MAE02_03120 [Microvirga aerophila]
MATQDVANQRDEIGCMHKTALLLGHQQDLPQARKYPILAGTWDCATRQIGEDFLKYRKVKHCH